MKKILCRTLAVLVVLAMPALGMASTDKTLNQCRAKLKAAKKLDVLYDMSWQTGQKPKIVVGPIYQNLPFDARENFALTVNCFLMAGNTDKFIDFPLLDYRTHEVINYFSYGHLTEP